MTATADNDWCELLRVRIDLNAAVKHVRADRDGAIVTFDGFVRNESHGRRTLYLQYEAYESMALTKMREICAQVRATYSIHRLAILHRLIVIPAFCLFALSITSVARTLSQNSFA